MKNQMCSENDIYHSQEIDENNMGQMHYKRNVYQNKSPNIEIMILFMETHKCVLIMIEIVMAISVIANRHHVMFFYWEIVLLIGITRSKPLLLCCQHKLNI
jgi:hypothetical protein